MSWIRGTIGSVVDEVKNNAGNVIGNIPDPVKGKAGEVINDNRGLIDSVFGIVSGASDDLLKNTIPPDQLQDARTAIKLVIADAKANKPVAQPYMFAAAGSKLSFVITTPGTKKFTATSNARYCQTVFITVQGPSGIDVAKTMFYGQGEGEAMKNERGQEAWLYGIKTASSSRPWRVTITFFYQESPSDQFSQPSWVGRKDGNPTFYGSEDASDGDKNDTIVGVEDK